MKALQIMAVLWILFALGCVSNAPNNTQDQQENPYFSAYYSGDNLIYTANITKPTPCHRLGIAETLIEETNTLVVSIKIIEPEPDVICIQVTDNEVVNGNVFAKPDKIEIELGGLIVYSKAL